MKWQCLILLCLIPGMVIADGEKKFVVSGATWNSIGGEKHNPARTCIVETDSSGRLSSLNLGKDASSAINIVYEQDKCLYSFKSSIVTISVTISWKKKPDGTALIQLKQQNDVPEQDVVGTIYPKKTLNKSINIFLDISNNKEYSWKEEKEYSWLDSDGNSRYTCYLGKKVVWDEYVPASKQNYQTILDGHTSDASELTTVKMMYTKKGKSVIGKQYFTYEPTKWDESTWYKGGSIEYSGDSLSNEDPLINVVNYYILSSYFYNSAWTYIGPSLFNIPIR